MQRTFSIIKPDAVERNLTDKIKDIFVKNDLKILDSKKLEITKEEAAEFYKVHQSKPFFDALCNYLSSGPIIVIILEGKNAVKQNRDLMGATDPKNAAPNTIRKLYGNHKLVNGTYENAIHGSDSIESAEREINFFFASTEINKRTR